MSISVRPASAGTAFVQDADLAQRRVEPPAAGGGGSHPRTPPDAPGVRLRRGASREGAPEESEHTWLHPWLQWLQWLQWRRRLASPGEILLIGNICFAIFTDPFVCCVVSKHVGAWRRLQKKSDTRPLPWRTLA